MCWSPLVSILFSLVHITALIVTKRKSYRLFCLFYSVMEIYQALQWILGDVRVGCTNKNAYITSIAYVLIWLQPPLYVYLAYLEGIYLGLVKYMAWGNFIWAIISLCIGYLADSHTYVLPNSNYGYPMCTHIGESGHLLWIFSPATIIYQPTSYVYILLILPILIVYHSKLNVITYGWTASLIYSSLWVGLGGELAAVWCTLSVFVSIPIILISI